jgi:putative ABC transport system permease protein
VRIAAREPGRYQAPVEIVGVVPGIRNDLFDRTVSPHIYVPFSAKTRSWMNYHIRVAEGGPSDASMVQTVRREIRAFDERLPVLTMTTLRTFADRSVFLWVFRSAARILTAFGLAALLLALVGIYGVNAYVVARRTREIGIRMALGATAGNIVRLVLRDAVVVSLAGIGIGLLLAVALGQGLSSMLFEVSATDPLALTLAPVLLAASTLIACYVPARRATRASPVEALRHD